eukprot:tig00000520_g1810.t2
MSSKRCANRPVNRYRHCIAIAATKPFNCKGIRNDKARFPGYFHWRDIQFSTPGVYTNLEDTARLRDRYILACQQLDRLQGVAPVLSSKTMNFPCTDYEGEEFFGALQRWQLKEPAADCSDTYAAARLVRQFLAKMGVASTPGSVRRRAGRAKAPDVEDTGATSGDGEDLEEGEDAPLEESVVDCVVKLDNDYFAAFFLEDVKASPAPQVISPPLASVDDALRFLDRCRIAWFGPDGESRYGMETHFPKTEYTSESWYKKLFTGPKKQRLKIGDNDPDWDEDHAAAVDRMLAFIVDELGLALDGEQQSTQPEGSSSSAPLPASSSAPPPASSASPDGRGESPSEGRPAKKQKTRDSAAGWGGERAQAQLQAATTGLEQWRSYCRDEAAVRRPPPCSMPP